VTTPSESELNTLERELKRLAGEVCDNTYYAPPDLYSPDSPMFSEPHYKYIRNIPYFEFIRIYITINYAVSEYVPLVGLQFGTGKTGLKESSYRLGIFGTWHILQNAESLCAYVGGLDHDGKLLQNIQILQNRHAKQVVFIRDKLNLFIEFDSNYWLGVFHAEGVSSGFRYEEAHGSGLSAGGTDWTLINGKIQYSWWMS
jgi:hypothetical protein